MVWSGTAVLHSSYLLNDLLTRMGLSILHDGICVPANTEVSVGGQDQRVRTLNPIRSLTLKQIS